jgi:hypothetical protein
MSGPKENYPELNFREVNTRHIKICQVKRLLFHFIFLTVLQCIVKIAKQPYTQETNVNICRMQYFEILDLIKNNKVWGSQSERTHVLLRAMPHSAELFATWRHTM